VQIIADDGVNRDTTTSPLFTIDTRVPAGMANMAFPDTTAATVRVSWTAVTVEKHFSHYEIWFGKNQSDVQNRTGTATEWDFNDDPAMKTKTNGTTIVAGVLDAATYYFKIWAYDSAGNFQELADKSLTKTLAAITTFPHYQDWETGVGNYVLSGIWSRVNNASWAHTGSYLARTGVYGNTADERLTSAAFNLNGYNEAWFTFWHKWDFNDGYINYDGGVIEADTTGGDNWFAVMPASNYHDSTLQSNAGSRWGNPLGDARPAYTMDDFYSAWEKDSVNLSPYVNAPLVRLRFRVGSDSSGNATGWDIDDFAVYASANSAPAITGLGAAAKAGAIQATNGNGTVTIGYEVSDPEQTTVTITAFYRVNATGWIAMTNTSGDIGTVAATSPTTDRYIVWNAGAQLGQTDNTTYQIRIIADDGARKDTVFTDSILIDTKLPVGSLMLTGVDSSKTTLSFTWSPVTETHFTRSIHKLSVEIYKVPQKAL